MNVLRSSQTLLILLMASAIFLGAGGSTSLARADRVSFANYEKALRAVRFKQWQEAVESLRQALMEKPEEIAGLVTRPYGMHFEPYLPHFYLGLALCKSGHPEEALEHWRHSDEQGALAKTHNADELLEKRRQCELNFLPQALEETRRHREQTRHALDAVAEIAPRDAMIWTSSRTTELHALNSRFEMTNESFTATANAPLLNDVLALSERYRQQQTQAENLRRRLQAARQTATEARTLELRDALNNFRLEMEQTRIAAEELEQQLLRVETPLPNELEERIRQVVKRVFQMDLALSESDLETVTLEGLQSWRQQWTNLRSSIANLSQRAESSRLSPDLLAAATSLFAGDYAQTLKRLEAASFPRPRSAAQAALLRAAAHHGLYLRSASADAKHLRRAREEIADCHRTDPLLAPDERFFSPRFQKLFAESIR